MNLNNLVLVAGGSLTGILAGLFTAFSVAVVPALRGLKAAQHIAAMQLVNVRILNPAFFLIFMGPALLLPWAAYLHRSGARFVLLVLATAVYLIGVIGVTIAGNVPLNDRLAKVDVTQISDTEADQIRQDYQGPGALWMRLHTIRTVAGILATGLVFIACVAKGLTE